MEVRMSIEEKRELLLEYTKKEKTLSETSELLGIGEYETLGN